MNRRIGLPTILEADEEAGAAAEVVVAARVSTAELVVTVVSRVGLVAVEVQRAVMVAKMGLYKGQTGMVASSVAMVEMGEE